MAKKLMIVESPAKAKTITRILGKDFKVMASVGHIRDLSNKGRGKKKMGIDIENSFQPDYAILPGKEKIVEGLRKEASKAKEIYLAPDPDREGEAIAWHLMETLDLDLNAVKRVTYQAVTPKAIKEAIDNPKDINMALVHSQQARRILDRLVGFRLSPFLWQKIAKNLSAGRVQSVALKIVVDREAEIKAFIPQEYWKIDAFLEHQKTNFIASLVRWNDQKFELGNENCSSAGVESILEELRNAEYIVDVVEKKTSSSKPSAPFITSTLQQAASSNLGFNPAKTMRVAQQLYEGIELPDGPQGLITYMRTDSVRIAPEGLEEARNYISQKFSKEYLPEKPQLFSGKNNSQDAHEAIRPYHVMHTPDFLKAHLSNDQLKLYRLIWLRFLASQMSPAIFDLTTIRIKASNGIFEAKGRQLVFNGYMALTGIEKENKNKYQDLPLINENDHPNFQKLEHTQHFTTPPPRYSEAGLIRTLEKEGIGRPSTYAPIIQTLKERGYALLKEKAFHPSELGIVVTDMLRDNFADILDLHFTAQMEEKLDEVEEGKTNWQTLLKEFYTPFDEEVQKAIDSVEPLKGRRYEGEERCPICGKELVIRYSTRGAFLGCSNYPECAGLLPMPGEQEETDNNYPPCTECGSMMVIKTSRYGKQFLTCSRYPECKHSLPLDKNGAIIELPKIERECDLCHKPMQVKMGRQGPFLACSGYPECKNTLTLDKNGNVITLPKLTETIECDKCHSQMVVKMSRRGPFLACSAYPKCRNAKPLPATETKDEQ